MENLIYLEQNKNNCSCDQHTDAPRPHFMNFLKKPCILVAKKEYKP